MVSKGRATLLIAALGPQPSFRPKGEIPSEGPLHVVSVLSMYASGFLAQGLEMTIGRVCDDTETLSLHPLL